MTVSQTDREAIESQGFGFSGNVGGQPTVTYWTPDGRQIKSMPDMHEYARRDNRTGKIAESGLRDANLDKGWLLAKPDKPQLYCPHCDKWHKTKTEVDACGRSKKRVVLNAERRAKKELGQEDDDRIGKLESEMSEIKGLLRQLVEKR